MQCSMAGNFHGVQILHIFMVNLKISTHKKLAHVYTHTREIGGGASIKADQSAHDGSS